MSPIMMHSWHTTQNGLDKLYEGELEVPKPGPGEVLVEILSVSLNFRDTEVCMGLYGHHKSINASPELVPCSDMSGIISNGNGTKWKNGTHVISIFNQSHQTGQITAKDMSSGLGLPLPGVLVQYRCFPEHGLVAAPEYMSNNESCNLPIASVTAWMSINGFNPLGHPASDVGRAKSILFQGTGGVSIAGLQIAHAAGFKTIITSSSDEKLQKARELGADHVINYKTNLDWDKEVMKITNDTGVDIIFETGGAQTLRKSLDCIAFGGLINCIGYLSGKEEVQGEQLHTNVLVLRRNVTVKGIINGSKDRFEECIEFYKKHEIHPVIDRVFKWEQADEALKYLYSGSHFGKVVVQVDSQL